MGRPRSELQSVLEGLDGNHTVYHQPPSAMQFPCIVYERGLASFVQPADNLKYHTKKAWTVTVIDRNADSLIPDQVEGLTYARFDRYFRTDGLHHHVYQLYF